MTWNTFPLVVESITDVTPSVRHFGLRRGDRESMEYTAGQFINIHFDRDGSRTHRSYSIANAPEGGELVEIAVAPVEGGFATGRLIALEPGDMVEASGPYGRFVLKDDPSCRYVLVATGTGVTPYRSMLPQLAGLLEAGEHEVELMLGVRSQQELLYGEEFSAMAATNAAFGFTACYSREMPEESKEWERDGYVQTRFDQLGLDPERDIVYLCGNPNMVDEAVEILKEAGFGMRQIRREKYLSART